MFNAWPFAIKFARHEPRIFVQMQLVSTVSLRGNYAYSRDRLNIHNLGSELLHEGLPTASLELKPTIRDKVPGARPGLAALRTPATPSGAFFGPAPRRRRPSAALPEPAGHGSGPNHAGDRGRRIARAGAGDVASGLQLSTDLPQRARKDRRFRRKKALRGEERRIPLSDGVLSSRSQKRGGQLGRP
jgi:hypothetical protein